MRSNVWCSINEDYCVNIICFLDINIDLSFSSSWAILDRLLTCLCRNAEMLSEQGSVLEAKSLLKEALVLARKFHLSFWYDLLSL